MTFVRSDALDCLKTTFPDTPFPLLCDLCDYLWRDDLDRDTLDAVIDSFAWVPPQSEQIPRLMRDYRDFIVCGNKSLGYVTEGLYPTVDL